MELAFCGSSHTQIEWLVLVYAFFGRRSTPLETIAEGNKMRCLFHITTKETCAKVRVEKNYVLRRRSSVDAGISLS